MAVLSQTVRRIDAALQTADTTRHIRIGSGLLSGIADLFRSCFGEQRAVIIADSNTWTAAGQAALANLEGSGHKTLPPLVFSEADFYAHTMYVEQVHTLLYAHQAIPVAVGSGTINDIVKLASFRCDREYMVVATAASMDGYTAFGASISHDGFKQTFFCPAPVAVLVDLDVIAAAPRELNAAGYADLAAKIPAGADWLLADALDIEPVDAGAWHMVQKPLQDWLHDADAVREADATALTGLMEGLLMSGLAMQKTKTSRPASGAEHQFSHLWDNQHLRLDGAIPFHGFKVAIGSLASVALYQTLLQSWGEGPSTDPAVIQGYWPEWPEIEKRILFEFPDEKISQMVLEESRKKYLPAAEIARRMTKLMQVWPELEPRLRQQLPSVAQLRQQLVSVGAPTLPTEIGLTFSRLQKSHYQAQLIRRRFTILDLALECGYLHAALQALFSKNGFWRGETNALASD